jgi:hypothetical protein
MTKLTAKLVEAKLREASGNIAAVARVFGVSRQAILQFVNRRPMLQAVLHECRETMLDNAESVLYSAVLAGEAWAVCFYLKTQGKARGYIEKLQIDQGAEIRQRVVGQADQRQG